MFLITGSGTYLNMPLPLPPPAPSGRAGDFEMGSSYFYPTGPGKILIGLGGALWNKIRGYPRDHNYVPTSQCTARI